MSSVALLGWLLFALSGLLNLFLIGQHIRFVEQMRQYKEYNE